MSSIELPAACRAPNSGAPMYTASAPACMAAFPTARSRAGARSDMGVDGVKCIKELIIVLVLMVLAEHVAEFVHNYTRSNADIERVLCAILWNLDTSVRCIYYVLLYSKNLMPHDDCSLLIMR